MATSMVPPDQQPTELYASVAAQWARQRTAYLRSVRLFQAQLSRQREHRKARPGRAAQLDLALRRRSARIEILDAPNGDAIRPALEVMVRPSAPTGRALSTGCPLTARQLEIAELIAQGLTNAQIAERLVLSQGTVGNHVGQMLRRLGAHNRAQIAAWMTARR